MPGYPAAVADDEWDDPADGAVDPASLARRANPATIAVTAGRPEPRPGAPMTVPAWMTSTYVAGGPHAYGRNGNPTWQALEEALGQLEGGQARVFASGAAATAAVLEAVLEAALPTRPAIVVAPRGCYYATLGQFRRAAAQGRFVLREVPIADTDAAVAALDGATLLWAESPTNPLLEVADLPALVAAARARGVHTAVDNTLATPLGQRPLELGADVVVHSATKYLAGHSDLLLGATVTRDDPAGHALDTAIAEHRTLYGAVAGPQEAWLALRGLRTLAVRVERSQSNAAQLAARLATHPVVSRVRHPSLPDDPGHHRARKQLRGYGSVVSVEVHGGAVVAERVAASTRLWVHATSLGGVESTLERRRRHPGELPDVPDDLLRLSVGIEDVDDLWHDFDQALTAAQPS
ncbi:MAG: trans-sulfuration enzyme family protein [Angustibacter sp.]